MWAVLLSWEGNECNQNETESTAFGNHQVNLIWKMLAQVEKKVDCFVLFFELTQEEIVVSVFQSVEFHWTVLLLCLLRGLCCSAFLFKRCWIQVRQRARPGHRSHCFLLQKLLSDCDCDCERHLISQCYDVSTCVYEAGMSWLCVKSSYSWVVLLYIINLVKFLNVTPDKCQHDYD